MADIITASLTELGIIPAVPAPEVVAAAQSTPPDKETALFSTISNGEPENAIPMHVWASSVWIAIESLIGAQKNVMNEEELMMLRATLVMIGRSLPCARCARHFVENVQAMNLKDPNMYRKAGLLRWVATIRNKIRVQQGREPTPLVVAAESMREELGLKKSVQAEGAGEATSVTKVVVALVMLAIIILICVGAVGTPIVLGIVQHTRKEKQMKNVS